MMSTSVAGISGMPSASEHNAFGSIPAARNSREPSVHSLSRDGGNLRRSRGKPGADREHHLVDIVGQRFFEREGRRADAGALGSQPAARLRPTGRRRSRPAPCSAGRRAPLVQPARCRARDCRRAARCASNAPQVAVPASAKRRNNVSAKLLDSEAAEQRSRDSASITLQHRAHRELI